MKKGTFKISKKTTKGKTYYTAAIVKSYRENGKVKQKTIKSFGGVTWEEAQRLKLAYTAKSIEGLIHIDDIECEEGVSYGGIYLVRHLWERIGLNGALKGCRGYFPEIFAMVCQRLFAPNSKLHLNEWAPDTALTYLVGLRLQEPVPHRCYFALDRVITNREALEGSFPLIAKEFAQDLSRLYYDITSTYFEGSKLRIAFYGYSRDKRPDKRQIIIGLLTTVDGFPIKVFIYEGNRCDKGTIEEVMGEIKRTFPMSEVTIVLDRGMITKKNLQYIEAMGYKYIIALRKTDSADIVNSPFNEAEMQPLKEGQYVRLFETLTDRYDEKEITRDAIYDGVYVLRTNKEGLSSEEIVGAYKQLMRVEMAFRCLKDILQIRPVYHWREDRVKAHVYICVISYLIHTVIEYLLKRNGIQISADTLLERISRVKLITLTDKAHKVVVHKVTKKIDEETRQALSALGIKTIKAEQMYWRK